MVNLVLLLGAALLIGGWAARQLWPQRPPPLLWLGIGGAALALGAAFSVFQTLSALGMWSPANVLDYLMNVGAGRSVLLLLLGVCLLLASEISAFSRLTSLGAAGLTLWGLAGIGHGASHGLFVHFLHVLHAGAMCLWLGGVFTLLTSKNPTAAEAQRFSPFALGSVLTLAVSGVSMSVNHLGNVQAIAQSDYGRTIILKVVFFVVALPVVLLVRRAFARAGLVKLWLVGETLLLLVILVITARLIGLPPPSHTHLGM